MKESKSNAIAIKSAIIAKLESMENSLTEISMEIHRNPETAMKEFKSSKLLAGFLEKNGFRVEYGGYGIDTAFRATSGKSGPIIGIMCEYDALEEIGHACGHNLIGTSAAAAGAALASEIEKLGGTVVVFGTPAEETGQGKEIMASKGAFDDIDAAMMTHPFYEDRLICDCGSVIIVKPEYFGESAHPCNPWYGINALDAMLIGFGAFNTLRHTWIIKKSEEEAAFGVITKGIGASPGVVPDHTSALLWIFGPDREGLKKNLEKVYACFKAGENATGAHLKFNYDFSTRISEVVNNKVLAGRFDKNIKTIRSSWNPVNVKSLIERAGTDFGIVSKKTPGLHIFYNVAPGISWHSIESAKACASDFAHKAMFDSAKAMAITVADLMMEPELLSNAKEEFTGIKNSLG